MSHSCDVSLPPKLHLSAELFFISTLRPLRAKSLSSGLLFSHTARNQSDTQLYLSKHQRLGGNMSDLVPNRSWHCHCFTSGIRTYFHIGGKHVYSQVQQNRLFGFQVMTSARFYITRLFKLLEVMHNQGQHKIGGFVHSLLISDVQILY